MRWESQKKMSHRYLIIWKNKIKFVGLILKVLLLKIYREMVAAVARRAHNPKVGGSIPSLATKKVYKKFDYIKMFSYLCRPTKKRLTLL